jgi:hypothetical protein
MCKQQEVKLESRDIAAVRKGERMPRKEGRKAFLGFIFWTAVLQQPRFS